MIKDKYLNRCRIRRLIHKREMGMEKLYADFECSSLPGTFNVLVGNTKDQDPELLDNFDKFEWFVEFFSLGSAVKTVSRKRTVEFSKDKYEFPILSACTGQIVDVVESRMDGDLAKSEIVKNEIVIDIGSKKSFYIFVENSDQGLKTGDWVEIRPHSIVPLPYSLPFLTQVSRLIKIPKD